MGEIIQLQRRSVPSQVRSGVPASAPILVDPWLLPISVMRASIAFWTSCWLAPLGLKVDLAERDQAEIGQRR